MKKKNMKNHIRMRFSTLLLCCLAIVLCAAPVLHADVSVPANETCDIDGLVDGVLRVEFNGTANLLTGASVSESIYVLTGGTLNMYSGTVGWFISVSPDASMTVYGTGFNVDDYPCDYGEVTLIGGMGTLKGSYGDGSSINLWVWSNIAINLQPPPSGGPEEITIDIKPGGNPNNINLKSKGVVPVAVLTTDGFDAGNIDPTTVTFAGAAPVRWKLEDVDDDGDKDMLLHFKTQDLLKGEENLGGLDEYSKKATLTGTITSTITSTMTSETTDGKEIRGTDKVCIVPGKKK